MEYQIIDELYNISSCLKVNKLDLNIKETHHIVFIRKEKAVPDLYIKFDGEKCIKNKQNEIPRRLY